MTSPAAISNLCKSFAEVRALHKAQLEIVAGEVHALTGENGAGKSTLMKTLGGVYQKREAPAAAFNLGAAAAAF